MNSSLPPSFLKKHWFKIVAFLFATIAIINIDWHFSPDSSQLAPPNKLDNYLFYSLSDDCQSSPKSKDSSSGSCADKAAKLAAKPKPNLKPKSEVKSKSEPKLKQAKSKSKPEPKFAAKLKSKSESTPEHVKTVFASNHKAENPNTEQLKSKSESKSDFEFEAKLNSKSESTPEHVKIIFPANSKTENPKTEQFKPKTESSSSNNCSSLLHSYQLGEIDEEQYRKECSN